MAVDRSWAMIVELCASAELWSLANLLATVLRTTLVLKLWDKLSHNSQPIILTILDLEVRHLVNHSRSIGSGTAI